MMDMDMGMETEMVEETKSETKMDTKTDMETEKGLDVVTVRITETEMDAVAPMPNLSAKETEAQIKTT